MTSTRKFFALSALALACMSGVSAMADTIVFNTSGQFVSQNGNPIAPTSTVSAPLGAAPGLATLSFAGLTGATVTTDSTSNISFGEFTLTITPPPTPSPYPSSNTSFSTATLDYGFSLNVQQLTPVPTGAISDPFPPTLLGNLHGKVTYTFNANHTQGSSTTLNLSFDAGSSITFFSPHSEVTYYVDNVRLAAPQTNNGVTSVQGQLEFSPIRPAPVPTPAALTGGTGLLAVLAAAKFKRTRAAKA